MYSEDGDSEEDEGELEYFTEKRDFSFLLNDLADENGKPSKKAKVEQSTEDNYAAKRYKEEKGKPQAQEVHHMLPLKTPDGGVLERSRPVPKVKTEEVEETKEEEKEKEVVPKSIAELYSLRQQYIAAAKQDIAKMCCAITEDPYNNVSSMKKLRSYCSTEDKKAGQTIRKLAILSLTAIYNDILPAYKVKPAADLDSLSKEVKVQHTYESELLRNYRVFLDLLFENLNLAFQSKKQKVCEAAWQARRKMGLLSLSCMAELLAKNYNFNLRSNLVNTVIPYGTSKAMGGKLAEIVIATIKELFEKDKQGECTVEIVRIIASLVKKKGGAVNSELLQTLIHVRLVELGEVRKEKEEALPDTSLLSKKQRKHRKEQAKVRKELLEAQAVEDKKKQSKLQSESLDHIFVTYFRVLKQLHDTPLLPIALAGLSKFAHLINVDFFTDLFECLKRIIKEEDLSLADSLNCVSTIFTILSGQGSVLEVDIGEFYTLLYQNILLFTPQTPSSTYTLLRQTLNNALKRNVALSAQMAMVKRLCTVSTHLNPEQAHIFLCEARKLIRASPRIAQMLQPDEDFGKPYNPGSVEPERANAEGAVLWEISGMAHRSYHQSLRTTATHFSRYDPNSTKRSEVEYFLNNKFKTSQDFVILDDSFPKSCKKMQNRRIKLPEYLNIDFDTTSDLSMMSFLAKPEEAS